MAVKTGVQERTTVTRTRIPRGVVIALHVNFWPQWRKVTEKTVAEANGRKFIQAVEKIKGVVEVDVTKLYLTYALQGKSIERIPVELQTLNEKLDNLAEVYSKARPLRIASQTDNVIPLKAFRKQMESV